MSHSHDTVTEELLDTIRKDVMGKMGYYHKMPKCRECENELQVGDTIDGKYPWFSDNNLCMKCKTENIREKKIAKWNEEIKTAEPTDNEIEMWLAKKLVENLRFEINQGGQNISFTDKNQYAVGYWSGLLQNTMSLIAKSPISKQAWQAAGLTYEEMDRCQISIIG